MIVGMKNAFSPFCKTSQQNKTFTQRGNLQQSFICNTKLFNPSLKSAYHSHTNSTAYFTYFSKFSNKSVNFGYKSFSLSSSSLYSSPFSFQPAAHFSTQDVSTYEEYMKKPEIQSILRQFLKKVHPDVIMDPIMKETNQVSVTELLSFVENWRQRPAGTPFAAAKKKEIFFFVKREYLAKSSSSPPSDTNTTDEKNDIDNTVNIDNKNGENEEFEKIEMSLFINHPFNTIRKEFARVFRLLGLSSDFRVGDKIITKGEDSTIDKFILKNVQLARELSEKEISAYKELNEVIQNLEKYKIKLYRNEFWDFNSNSDNLRKLKRFYELLTNNFSNRMNEIDQSKLALEVIQRFRINFDPLTSGCEVDYEGKIVGLNEQKGDEDWERTLISLNPTELDKTEKLLEDIFNSDQPIDHPDPVVRQHLETERKVSKLQRKETEMVKSVSLAFSIKSIDKAPTDSYFLISNQDSESNDRSISVEVEFNQADEYKKYLLFLENLDQNSGEIKKFRTWKDKKYKNLQLFVRSFSDPQKLFTLTEEGNIYISNKLTIPQITKIIDKLGARANELIRIEDEWENRKRFIMARLALRALHSSTSFLQLERDGLRKERKCIEKLEENMQQLRSLNLSGLELGISNEFSVSDGGVLWIKWNFEFESMKQFLLEATQENPSLAQQD